MGLNNAPWGGKNITIPDRDIQLMRLEIFDIVTQKLVQNIRDHRFKHGDSDVRPGRLGWSLFTKGLSLWWGFQQGIVVDCNQVPESAEAGQVSPGKVPEFNFSALPVRQPQLRDDWSESLATGSSPLPRVPAGLRYFQSQYINS